MELTGSALAIIPTAFGAIISTLLDFGIDLTRLIPILLAGPQFGDPQDPANAANEGIDRLIYETSRISPTFRMLMRGCSGRHAAERRRGRQGRLGHGADRRGEHGQVRLSGAEDVLAFSLSARRAPRHQEVPAVRRSGDRGGGGPRVLGTRPPRALRPQGGSQGGRSPAGPAASSRRDRRPAEILHVNIGLLARFAHVLPPWRPHASATRP